MILLIEGQDYAVRQNVIDKIGCHRGGVSEVADLNRCWTVRQDCGTRLLGMTLEVYGDVNIKIKQNLSYFAVAA